MSDPFGFVGPLRAALDYHVERHNVLLSNVAHVDTPGYVPRDLARVDAPGFATVLGVALERTQAAHIAGHATGGALVGRTFEDPSAGPGNDRNAVSLDREASKVAANQVRYDVVSTILSAELAQLAFAAGDGRG